MVCVCSTMWHCGTTWLFVGIFFFIQNNFPLVLLIKTWTYLYTYFRCQGKGFTFYMYSLDHVGEIYGHFSSCIHQSCLASEAMHGSFCKGLQYNAHLMVMAMDYFIVFCLWSALIALPSALCTVQCHLPTQIQTSIFLSSPFQYIWNIFPAAKEILEILFTMSTWDISVVKRVCRQAWNNMV